MYPPIAALALCGFMVKFTDDLVDEKKMQWLPLVTGLAYGALGAYAVLEMPVLAPLAVGIVFGVLLAKKIDHAGHAIGLAAFALPLFVRPLPMELWLPAFFCLAALFDEIGNNLADKKKLRGALKHFFDYRLSVEAAALLAGIATANWLFLMGIVAFDIGYIIAEKISGNAIVASL